MKVAMISYRLPVQGEKRGGIERVAHDLAEGLSRRGHAITMFSYDPKPANASYEVRLLPGKSLFESWLGRRVTMGYLGNFLCLLPDYREFDVLLAHGDSILLPLKHERVVRVMHGSAFGEALSSHPLRMILQLGVYAQEWLTTLGPTACVAVSQNTVLHHPMARHMIYNGIDRTVFFPGSGRKTSAPSILFVGTMKGRKRGDLLLRIFENCIRPSIANAELHMVSPPGPEVCGVTYHYGIDQTMLADLYRSAWVFASPSSYEGFGLPYVEAMASGTPVIASPNPGSLEITDGGRLGRIAEDKDFGDHLRDLLSDSSERARLTELGLERATHFDLERTLDRYEEIIGGQP